MRRVPVYECRVGDSPGRSGPDARGLRLHAVLPERAFPNAMLVLLPVSEHVASATAASREAPADLSAVSGATPADEETLRP